MNALAGPEGRPAGRAGDGGGGARSSLTVSVAGRLVTLPESFVTTTRKVAPLSAGCGSASVYDAAVAPGMSVPSRCHW